MTKLKSTTYKYVTSIGFIGLSKFLKIIVTFVVGILVVKHLNPEGYGIYAFAIAVTSFFFIFVKLGIAPIVIIDLSNEPKKKSEIISTAIYLKLLASFISFAVLTACVIIFEKDYITRLCIILVGSSVFFQFHEIFKTQFEYEIKGKEIGVVTIVHSYISSILKIIAIANNASVEFFCIILIIDHLVHLLAYLAFTRFSIFRNKLQKFDLGRAKSMLSRSWPMLISAFGVILYMRIDQVMIKIFLGIEDVGYYSAVVKISESFNFIAVALVSGIFPLLVKINSNSDKDFKYIMLGLYRATLFTSIFISLLIFIFNEQIINILFGIKYAKSAPVLAIYCWSIILIFMGLLSTKWMILSDNRGLVAINTFSGAILNILLNIYLIPLYGIKGAAYATLISCSFTVIIFDVFYSSLHKNLKFKLLSLNLLPLPNFISYVYKKFKINN